MRFSTEIKCHSHETICFHSFFELLHLHNILRLSSSFSLGLLRASVLQGAFCELSEAHTPTHMRVLWNSVDDINLIFRYGNRHNCRAFSHNLIFTAPGLRPSPSLFMCDGGLPPSVSYITFPEPTFFDSLEFALSLTPPSLSVRPFYNIQRQ